MCFGLIIAQNRTIVLYHHHLIDTAFNTILFSVSCIERIIALVIRFAKFTLDFTFGHVDIKRVIAVLLNIKGYGNGFDVRVQLSSTYTSIFRISDTYGKSNSKIGLLSDSVSLCLSINFRYSSSDVSFTESEKLFFE
jgi:hypothetical protein